MSASMPARFDALTGLRALAATWVLGYHLRFYFPDQHWWGRVWGALFDQGYLGVDVFFVLSGFVLMHNYGGRELHRDAQGYRDFLRNRLARIYPAHLATLLMLVGVVALVRASDIPLREPFRYTLDGFVENLLLIQAWEFPVTHSWNINAWSISAEWAAYLCFPVIAWAGLRLRSAAAVWMGIALSWYLLHWFVREFPARDPGDYALPRVFAAFSAGVLTHRLWQIDWAPRLPWAMLALLAALALGMVGALAAGPRPQVLTLAAPLATLLVYGLARDPQGWARHLITPRLLFWGGASYALFLVHRVVLIALHHFLPARGLGDWQPLWALGVIVVSFLLAAWLYVTLEEPARERFRAPLRDPTAAR
jgi:peptidoglycan/LPS O-acetylase OafA/YrhL